MALRWLDSFDNIGSSAAMYAKYDQSRSNTNINLSTNQPRTGASSMRTIGAGFQGTRALGAVGTTAIIGLGLFMDHISWQSSPNVSGNSTGHLLDITEEDETPHIRLGMDTPGHLKLWRGPSPWTLIDTSLTQLTFDTYYYIELKVLIDNTVGTYEVRVDGINVLSGINTDTRNGAAAWNRVVLYNTHSNSEYIDDFYICDGSGARCNTFLGIQKVGSLIALADSVSAGSVHNFALSTGTDHGAVVDETSANGDTDYSFSSVVGDIELVKVATPTLTGTTRGIQINRYVRKTDAGVRQTAAVVRRSGVNYVQATQDPLTTYTYLSVPLEVDPSTGIEWTGAGIAAGEYGEKIIT